MLPRIVFGRIVTMALVLSASLVFFSLAVSSSVLAEKNPQGALYRLMVETAEGVVSLEVEIARTPREQQLGLMYRRSMPPDQGMIFLYSQPRQLRMWMKNTLIALDMLFIDQFSTIRHIHTPAIPHDETVISPPVASVAVLELNLGAARRLGIRVGDKVRLSALQ